MTTKNATLDVNTVTVSGLPPSPVPKPNTVSVSGMSVQVLQQVAHLCRQGYCPDENTAIWFSPETGAMSITLTIGSPDQAYVTLANEKLGDAQAAQEAEYRRDVEAAARRQIEAEKQAQRDAKRAALVATHEAALKAMQAEIDAL